jgi:uncharacterized protein (TIGR04551 family)
MKQNRRFLFFFGVVAASLAFALFTCWLIPAAEASGTGGGAPETGATVASDDDWDDGDDDFDSLFALPVGDSGGWEEEARPRTFPWFEHHGYFRFRSGLFWRAHLGTDRVIDGATIGSSGMFPPLTHNAENNQAGTGVFDPAKVGRGRDDETIAGANMRFRYSPTVHITSDLRIYTQLDLLDNIVLGSTPDFSHTASGLRPDVPLAVLGSGGQVPPTSGVNAFQDSIRVKQAFGEWNSILGLLRFGRMASHWGLGIFQNSGQAPNANFGDFVDRVSWTATLWGVHVMGAWDFAYEGPTSASPGHFYGQPYDLDQADDVNQWVLAIFQRPIDEEGLARRRVDLEERRVPVLDWGFYNLVRIQDLDLSYESSRLDATAPGVYDRLQFVQRNAWVWIPDIWLRFEWRPAFGRRLRVEMEALMALGRFNAVLGPAGDGGSGTERYEIMQYGGVLTGDYTMGGLSFGLEVGVASGDSTPGLGVLHPGNLYDDATGTSGRLKGRPNRRISNFIFDRDYHVDLLLFREVIGAVTNTVYFKPFIQYDLFEGDDDSLGARLDILYAQALEPGATPGGRTPYGIELDLRIFFEERGRFLATLEWGILFPFSALDLADGYMGYTGSRIKARWATTLQARVHWMF